jgi:pseudaminic acid synthase
MTTVEIAGKLVGDGQPTFIVAETSANHDQDLSQALELVDVAAKARVDAVKLQTYTPDSLTLPTSHPSARVDPVWGANNLYELYQKAAMPYHFHKPLFERAREHGLIAFSTAYDESSVDYLEGLGIPAYKVASFELVHLPLLRHIGQTRKPVILSTGMASIGEVEEALNTLVSAGTEQIILLHCCSVYPADPATVNLAAMQALRQAFGYPVGFSDHTLSCAVPVAAVALGACMIEKHFTNDPQRPGPDHRFSTGPKDLRRMVEGIREAEMAIGNGRKAMAACEAENRAVGRRSLFAAVDIPPGAIITREMIRVVRPGAGLHPRYLEVAVGRVARQRIPAGWPIIWEDI